MRRAFLMTACIVLAAGGCVRQDRYDNTVTGNRTLKEQLVAAQRECDTANANLETVQQQLAKARETNSALQSQVGTLDGDLQKQAARYDDLLRRVSQLDLGPLPMDLAQALDQLAARFPDVLSFDAATGMLRFASDFSFDLGSAELKPEASATITTLAEILNSKEAQPFEIRLIGHTDNVPIERPATRAQHPTNVYLSVHRAISVRDGLVAAGVSPTRFEVAGYGEFRPVAPNGPKGAAQNRRVELVLVPMRQAAAHPAPPAPAAENRSAEEPMK
jgi:chemotaxis protein MotB